jgi:predicted ATPase/DNA-binding SARP family transcriptional activator
MTQLSLAFLGQYRVSLAGTPVAGFESDKVRALLAYLAVEAPAQRREVLAALLWPEMPEASARHNLSQVLFNLRQVIRDREAQPPFLLVSRDAIQFNPDSDYTLDIALFQRLLAASDAHGHAHGEICNACAHHLQQAVDLYQGDFLHQFFLADSAAFEEWTLVQREQLHRRALAALSQLTIYHEHHTEYGAALRSCERQLALDPWGEEAHQQMMRILALSGQRSAALAQYESCRRILAHELGVEPSPETRALYEQIRAGALSSNETRKQEERETSISPISQSPIFNLPTQLTPFLGRSRERTELGRLLADPACRLVTLTGPGGIGKTRLAVQAAQEQQAAFAQGVAFVALAPLTAGEQVAPAIAEALRFPFDGPTNLQRQLLNYLRQQELLLVLDNFEHLLAGGEGVTIVQAILQEAPIVTLLVTSHGPLDLQGEWVYEVAGLGEDAVDLFVQSARRVRAGFVLQAEDQPWVKRICRLVDEMPLGIELAASWVRLLSCAEIAAEIERNLDFLATPVRDAPERHRSLRAVFDHTWQLLTDAERQGLRRLAVFHSGFGREAAEAVAGVSLSLLSALVAKSLLHRTAAGRYDLHELVRQYAAARLQQEAEEAALTQRRQASYFATWLQQTDQAIRGALQPEGAAAIRLEIDNIRLAWNWATAQGEVAQLQPLIFTLYWFYDYSNRFEEGIEVFHQAAVGLQSLVERQPSPPAETLATLGHILAFEGWFNMRYGRLLKARELLARSVELLRPVAAPVALSDALRAQGLLYHLTGELQLSRSCLAESLTLKQIHGDDWEPSFQILHRGLLAYAQGDYRVSAALMRELVAIVRRLGHAHAMARALLRLSVSLLALGVDDTSAYDEAEQLVAESLQLSQRHEDRSAKALAFDVLGMIAQSRGDQHVAEAVGWFRRSLALYREIGDRWSLVRVLNLLGMALVQLDHQEEAAATFSEALTTALALETFPQALEALAGLATLAHRAGDHEQALLLALAVEQHPQSSSKARERAGQLRQSSDAHLPCAQVEVIRQQVEQQSFAALVEAVVQTQQ